MKLTDEQKDQLLQEYNIRQDKFNYKGELIGSTIIVMDCLQINYEMYVQKDDLYAAFCQYCEKNGLPLVAKNVFSMRLHEHVRIRDYRASIDKKRVQCWCGIGFSDASHMSGMSGFRHYFITQAHVSKDIKIGKHTDTLDVYDTEVDA